MIKHLGICCLLLILALFGCSRIDSGSRGSSVNQPEIAMPSAEEVPALQEQAIAGSQVAAMQLALWRMKFPGENTDTYEYWTRVAAENGSAAGQFNLAMLLMADSKDHLSQIRAKFWLEKSAAQGSGKANSELLRMKGNHS